MDIPTLTIIDAIIKAEGGDRETNDPLDKGGRTKFGLSEHSNPEVWADGDVTLAEARETYFKKYVVGPGFDKITDPKLQHQLVDFGVNSGPFVAVQRLQEALHVPTDGKLGPKTLDALAKADSRAINNALVESRVKLLCKICVKNPSQLKFLSGWVNRAFEFLV
jgi:lysozyme family protein